MARAGVAVAVAVAATVAVGTGLTDGPVDAVVVVATLVAGDDGEALGTTLMQPASATSALVSAAADRNARADE